MTDSNDSFSFDTKTIPQSDLDSVTRMQPWMLPAHDDATWQQVWDWERDHQHKWFKHVKQYRNVVQAGGCCGVYPRLLADRFQTVYTFEPSHISFYCLVNNCRKGNIIKTQAALGERVEFCTINYSPTNPGSSSIFKTGEGGTLMMPLDVYQLDGVDMIALDCESYERHVLTGARDTIRRCRPLITCENSHNCKDVWESFGYREVDKSAADSILIPKEW